MKLNVAAALFQSERRLQVRLITSWVLAGCILFSSGAAMALDGIDLSQPSAENGEGECSQLVQIKYPFLSCRDGEIGLADADDTWEDSRQIPLMSEWTEGGGYWGPSYNEEGAYRLDETKAER